MSNTDKKIVKTVCENIKYYRKSLCPDNKRMDFYANISENDDKISNIERGLTMPDFDFLVNLSISTRKTIDFFTQSGYVSRNRYKTAYEILEELSYKDQYQFMQEINVFKYQLFTSIDSSMLEAININETEKHLQGKLLKNARIKCDYSIPQLATLIDRSPSTISRMEKGSGETSPYVWIKISQLFNIPFDSFLFNRIKDYDINVRLIINHLVYDTFRGLDENEKTLMYSVMKYYKSKYLSRYHKK